MRGVNMCVARPMATVMGAMQESSLGCTQRMSSGDKLYSVECWDIACGPPWLSSRVVDGILWVVSRGEVPNGVGAPV